MQRGEILLSTATLEELADVLERDKFDRYLTGSDREEFLEAFVERATFVETTEEIRVCRDARDDKFLELAVSGVADYIITGDKELLSLNPVSRNTHRNGGSVPGVLWRRRGNLVGFLVLLFLEKEWKILAPEVDGSKS